jgi:hypothetical protein
VKKAMEKKLYRNLLFSELVLHNDTREFHILEGDTNGKSSIMREEMIATGYCINASLCDSLPLKLIAQNLNFKINTNYCSKLQSTEYFLQVFLPSVTGVIPLKSLLI